MTQLKFSKAAFATLYGCERVIITDETLLKKVTALAGDTFKVLCADSIGRVTAEGEAVDTASLRMLGMPLGLKAALLTSANKAVVAELGGERLLAKGKDGFEIFIAKPEDDDVDARLSAFFIALQNKLIASLAQRTMSLEAQTAYLRQSSERMMTALAMSERVMQAVGYSELALVASLPKGNEGVGPAGDVRADVFEQIFPTDGLGLEAVEIYALLPRKGVGVGYLEVSILRDFDGKLLAFENLPFQDLRDGWNIVRFSSTVIEVFGDVRLALRWHSETSEAAPLIALSDISGNRFGATDDDKSIALKVFKRACGVTVPDAASLATSSDPLGGVSVQPGKHPDRVAFYGGEPRYHAAKGEQSFDPFVVDAAAGTTRVHLATDGLTGLTFKTILPRATHSLDVHVSLPEAKGPDMAVHLALTDSLDGIEAHMTKAMEGTSHGLTAYASARVTKGQSASARLDASGCAGREAYLVLVAKTLEGTIANGWCQLDSLMLNAPASASVKLEEAYLEPRKVVRAIRLPELGNLVQFLYGADELHRLSVSGGFLPMLLDENGGYLQTHPLKGAVSAAILPSLVMPGTIKVVTTATTGHPHAPEFIYLAMLVRRDVADTADAVEAVAKALESGGPLGETVEEDEGAVYWHARKLKADEEARLELAFDVPLDAVYNIVLSALPIDGLTSFGWCRWTSLGIISQEAGGRS
ncbi:DUF6212 domain-containing protein [Kordiimonas sp.]|uniref:DUF6212 domain-containing protein n=1 Tax=Kordiimonas sp. TaxID=1970157 RepID=UPI003A915814